MSVRVGLDSERLVRFFSPQRHGEHGVAQRRLWVCAAITRCIEVAADSARCQLSMEGTGGKAAMGVRARVGRDFD